MFLSWVLVWMCVSTTFSQLVLQPYGIRMCTHLCHQCRQFVNFHFVASDLACHMTQNDINGNKREAFFVKSTMLSKDILPCYKFTHENNEADTPPHENMFAIENILLAKRHYRMLSLNRMNSTTFNPDLPAFKVTAMAYVDHKLLIATERPNRITFFFQNKFGKIRSSRLHRGHVYDLAVDPFKHIIFIVEECRRGFQITKLESRARKTTIKTVPSHTSVQLALDTSKQRIYVGPIQGRLLVAVNYQGESENFLEFLFSADIVFRSLPPSLYVAKDNLLYHVDISSRKQTVVWSSNNTIYNIAHIYGYVLASFADFGRLALIPLASPTTYRYIESGFEDGTAVTMCAVPKDLW